MKTAIFRIFTILSVVSGALVACQKEITLPYESIDPLYVIEGHVSPGGSSVSVSRTRDMESSDIAGNIVLDAEVKVSADGMDYPFTLCEDSLYRPSPFFVPEVGRTYSLSVKVDGLEYTAQSTLMDSVAIDMAGFRTLPILAFKTWLYSATFRDLPGEQYYIWYLYRNGELFAWDMSPDMILEQSVVPVDIPIESDEEAATGEAEHETIVEGDVCDFEIRTIDRKSYEYFYSMALTMLSYNNPVSAFNVSPSDGPKALGYFSAYSSSWRRTVFHREDE